MENISLDMAHFLMGILVLISFLLLYQDRLYALINIFIFHSLFLAFSVAWQAYIQDESHLYITAGIALFFKAMIIPFFLHRIIVRLHIDRELETVIGTDMVMLMGVGLVALSLALMLQATEMSGQIVQEDLSFSLSIILIGLLMMVVRSNAVSQIIGFMSLENGLILASSGAKGMPFVVEISVAFSILIAFIVIGLFLFRIRERFDTVDLRALDNLRGERDLSTHFDKVKYIPALDRYRGEGFKHHES